MTAPLLAIQNLVVGQADDGPDIVRDVSLTLERGHTLGLVGESGSGKTMIANAIMGMLRGPLTQRSGVIEFDGQALPRDATAQVRQLRGRRIGMIFQDPAAAFNPVKPVGAPLVESVMRHQNLDRVAARQTAISMLGDVGIPEPDQRMREFPHQFSGGQLQRIMIALALINNPDLVIADEPTTALDATVQVRILNLLNEVLEDRSLLLITHDLGVAGAVCDHLAILRNGELIESGATAAVLTNPATQYAKRLLAAVPTFRTRNSTADLTNPGAPASNGLSLRDLSIRLPQSAGGHALVETVSLELRPGRITALVGESGSGKTTIARALVGLGPKPASGHLRIDGVDHDLAASPDYRSIRKAVQMVFQHGGAALDPRWSVARSLAEAAPDTSNVDVVQWAHDALDQLDLPPDTPARRPSQLSGGQRQRVSLARALSAGPLVLVADEPLSALDVSTKQRLMTQLRALRDDGLSILIIAHELAMVYELADDLYVLRGGRIVESGPTRSVMQAPSHPYTAVLLASSYTLDTDFDRSAYFPDNDPPPDPALGCPFHLSCPVAQSICRESRPALKATGADRASACHHPASLPAPPLFS